MEKIMEEKVNQIFEQVAKRNNTTVADIKAQIAMLIFEGINNENPKIQKIWRQVPYNGGMLTPEDLVRYIFFQIEYCRN